MKRRAPETCEVKVNGTWRSATLIEAKGAYGLALKRCPACHGPVYVLGSYGTTQTLRLSHRRAHTGCPLTSKTFSGRPSPHPNALA